MKKIAMIPARYAATRFPYKLIQDLGGKSVIQHTYDNTLKTGIFDDVWVVTDHEIIYNLLKTNGSNVMMSQSEHESGSDRIAEAVREMDVDVVLNVQGDEPFVDRNTLSDLLDTFNDDAVQVSSVMKSFADPNDVANPNYVKVAVDKNHFSLLFSRSVIPFHRDHSISPVYWEHVGIYAFRKEALLQFTNWEMTPLEKAEKIECLRYLENGVRLKMIETTHQSVKIDVPEDLEKARLFLKTQNL
jgi:3-deoxy-manno-octulosonate cytidylyltransferase (CMP-KDO synthetase)